MNKVYDDTKFLKRVEEEIMLKAKNTKIEIEIRFPNLFKCKTCTVEYRDGKPKNCKTGCF